MEKLFAIQVGLGFPAKKNYAQKNAKMDHYVIMEFAFAKTDIAGKTARNYPA